MFRLVFLLLIGCQYDEAKKSVFQAPILSSGKRMFFTATDLQRTSSAGFEYEYSQGKITRIVSGQSGDSSFVAHGKDLYFFNRKPDLHNFFQVPLDKDETSGFFPIGGDFAHGDPTETLAVGDNKLLLAYRTSYKGNSPGRITLLDLQNGTNKILFRGSDFGLEVDFQPASLLRHSVGNDEYILIVHQGITYKGMVADVNNSQAIFAIKQTKDGTFQKVSGFNIGLKVSAPRLLKIADKLVSLGFCYRNHPGCIQGLQEISKDSAGKLVHFPKSLYGNGSLVPGFSGQTFFAQVEENKKPLLISASWESGSDGIHSKVLRSYNGRGADLLVSDVSGEYLFVGDFNPKGLLAVYNKSHELISEVPLNQLIPYRGLIFN